MLKSRNVRKNGVGRKHTTGRACMFFPDPSIFPFDHESGSTRIGWNPNPSSHHINFPSCNFPPFPIYYRTGGFPFTQFSFSTTQKTFLFVERRQK
ncbi:hypothetical protein COT49_03530 [candidate division WWE3 bacterium CG08_land_8_20_14_0_20_40_13]|uniref:Uncharacterized protein n=1 Tax=candidate division WWE3 bacterium CG08_land_8_20_14_0_20_40_13 TaxID=1975084 RepID=A0A2H0XFB3_UNCKA|nr:MAG: hypothetical protein COT49_03530 [candidate division WWE3 bacterium CG08_land_8_20_14_0_20_40_13]